MGILPQSPKDCLLRWRSRDHVDMYWCNFCSLYVVVINESKCWMKINSFCVFMKVNFWGTLSVYCFYSCWRLLFILVWFLILRGLKGECWCHLNAQFGLKFCSCTLWIIVIWWLEENGCICHDVRWLKMKYDQYVFEGIMFNVPFTL